MGIGTFGGKIVSELTKFFDKNKDELSKYFGTAISFAVWIGKHENELPFGYTVKDIIQLRLLTRKDTYYWK